MLTKQILFRLTAEGRARVEALQRQMQAEWPGVRVTLSDVLRYTILVASTPAEHPIGVAPEAATLTGVGQPTSQPPAPKQRKAKADAAA